MASFIKMPLITLVACILSIAFMAGWHYHASFHLPLAIACLSMILVQNRVAQDAPDAILSLGIPFVAFVIGALLSGGPTYAERTEIGRTLEACVIEKGALQPCYKEASALYGYDVSQYSLDRVVDWRKAMVGCIAVSGARKCVEDFANGGVAGEGVVTLEDFAAICAGEADRTNCLLDLSVKGYPFRSFKVHRGDAIAAVSPTTP